MMPTCNKFKCFLQLYIWVLLIAICTPSSAQANSSYGLSEEFPILINSHEVEFPPLFIRSEGQLTGVIPDIIAQMPNYKFVKYVAIPRKRVDSLFTQGQLHVSILHPAWTKVGETLHFVPLQINQTNRIYSRYKTQASDISELGNISLCTHSGYIYRGLNGRWEPQSIQRIDSQSESTMLQMLNLGRCDMLVASELVMDYLIFKQGATDTVFKTDIISTQLALFLAVDKRQTAFAKELEETINRLHAKNCLEALIEKYTQPTASLDRTKCDALM
ncbi:substrate-binding periplasmic protein [Sneathiella glossodoripedis]|uniref:substrate-binding periplasmic protein n=1 Tax=Sneathiella glossodoripedis TaxID=418853 RepID=UPI000471B7B5|nr:transporter substrate-binding domain-containing protein [Sneathiella glossodoripedis]